MKKTTLALAVAIASITSVANAAQPSNSWYVGGKLGWSKYFDTKSEDLGTIDSVTTSSLGGGAFVGYQMSPYFAAELGYDWLGKLSYKGKDGGDLTVHGASLTAKASYPLSFITDDLDVYARAGAFVSTARWKKDGHKDSETSIAPVYALGFDYRLTDSLSTRLEYQWVNNISNVTPNNPDNGLLSLGVVYNFGAPVVKTPELEVLENRFVLNEDILFAFGKADIKPEGKTALNELVATLMKLNPTEGAILVIGHTDRIGSDAFNLKLSEQRADSVMDYLVAQGVPANLITARGVGKAQPVTGDACNALKGQDLRTCLAPDRRVEIEVKAVSVEKVEMTNM